MVMTINVSPLAITPYDSIWDGITDDLLYIPTHLLADDDGATDLLDSNSTLASASAFTLDGTVAGSGANSGWFTSLGDNRIQVAGDSAVDAMMRTDTLTIGQRIILSYFLYIPAGGITTTSGLACYGKAFGPEPGFNILYTPAEKMQVAYTDGTTNFNTPVTIAQAADTTQHYMAVIEKTAVGFQAHVYQDGILTSSSADTATGGYSPIATSGLNIYSTSNANGTISNPLEADMQVSDMIIARTSSDITAEIDELAARQSRMRTSLTRKWADVL